MTVVSTVEPLGARLITNPSQTTMKPLHLIALACAALLTSTADAQDRRRGGGDDEARPTRAELLKRFDKNKDGELDEAERAAMRKAMVEARKKVDDKGKNGAGDDKGKNGAGGDKGKNGAGGDKGKNGAGEDRIPEGLLKRFDKDGDGKLNEEERGALRKAIGDRRGGDQGKRGGKGKGGDGPPPRRRGGDQGKQGGKGKGGDDK